MAVAVDLPSSNEVEIVLPATKHHSKAKHITIRYFFIRNDMVKGGRLKVDNIAGTERELVT